MLTFPIIKIHAERNKKKIYLDHLNRSSKKKILNSFRGNFSDKRTIFPYPLFFELNSNWIRSDFTKIHASITRGEMKKKGKNGEKTMSRDLTKSARWIFSIFRENSFFFFLFPFRKSSLLYFTQWASPIMGFLRFPIGKFVSSRVNLATEDWDLIWFAGDWRIVRNRGTPSSPLSKLPRVFFNERQFQFRIFSFLSLFILG